METQLHVPKQAAQAFKLLSQSGDLTARQLADKLGILPNTVYRVVRPLVTLGMVERSNTYPVVYTACPMSTAMEWYLKAAMRSFYQGFGSTRTKSADNSLPSITFIKDRDNLRIVTEQEAQKAKKSIDCVLSGHRVADSTILVYRKAVGKGVQFRVIIENDPNSSDVDHEAFELMGAQVRFLQNIGIRLFIFDRRTAVLTSYDPASPMRAFGIRFTYAPVAEQLGQLFEQRWGEAKEIALVSNRITP